VDIERKPNLKNKRKMNIEGEEMSITPILLRYPNLPSPVIMNEQSSSSRIKRREWQQSVDSCFLEFIRLLRVKRVSYVRRIIVTNSNKILT
jgi:hypothetical protein